MGRWYMGEYRLNAADEARIDQIQQDAWNMHYATVDIDFLLSIVKKMREDNEEMDGDNYRLGQEVNDLEDDLYSVRGENAELESEVGSLESERDELRDRVENLEREASDLKVITDGQAEHIGELVDEIDRLEHELAESNSGEVA